MAGLHLQGGLPEEQIGTDGGAEHRDDHQQRIVAERQAGQGGLADQGWPVHLDGEGDRDIGQQCQRQPFEPAHVGLITHVHLQRQAERAETRRIQPYRPSRDQMHRLRHRGDIRGQVERVGRQQQSDHGPQHYWRKIALDVGGQAAPRNAADARADELDRDHQRQRQRHGPQHRVAELRAGLGIGGDAAGIVVRRAGDQAGAQRGRADGRGLAPARASPPVTHSPALGRATGHCESLPDPGLRRAPGPAAGRAAQAGARGRPGRSHAGAARARAHPSPGCSGRCR